MVAVACFMDATVNPMRPRHTRRARYSGLAGCLAGLLAAAPAIARPPNSLVPASESGGTGRPTLTVLVVPAQPALEGTAARLRRWATSSAIASNRFEVIDPVDALDPDGARERKSRVAEGLAALRAARRAYNELDTANALAEANRALDALSEAGIAARMEDMTDAWLLKIASLTANGSHKAAQSETDRLLAVNPAARFSPDLFPPDRIAYAEKVRRKVKAGPARLDVRTRPPGAEVFVDGTFRGFSPVTVDELASGEHRVVATAPGLTTAQERSWPGAVELELRETERAELLRIANQGVANAPDAVKRDEVARTYAKSVGASEVVLIALTNAEGDEVRLTGARLDSTSGRRIAQQEEKIRQGELAERAPAVVESLLTANALPAGAIVDVTAARNARPTRPSNRQVTGWALLGTGAAAVVAGTVFGLSAAAKSREFRELAQTDPSAQEVAASGRRLALVADLSFVVAALAGGTGGYLTFWRDQPSGVPPYAVAEGAAR